jgi:Tol biopolymer transport system component/DNA-binding winged helix-turn-helix (wHTH) protein
VNERPILLKPVGPSSLADEEDFQLGEICVRPSLREIWAGEAREIVEPRVMQVLVALVRANGAVVSRDELIRQCWGGRIVGEDAINRTVSKIRQLAELGGGDKSFEIETIPRVGYRLRQKQPDVAREPPPRQVAAQPVPAPRMAAVPSAGHRSRWGLIITAVAAVATVVAIMAGALYFLPGRAPQWIVAESHLPFISTPLIERYPAIAPDGSMIAYSAGRLITDRQIFLRLLKGGDPIQLTHDAGDASAPAWSPDGKTIAYVNAQANRPCRIMEIPVPAGQSHQVGQCRYSERSSLAFDGSGRTLFFSDAPARGAGTRIFQLDLDNGRVSTVTNSTAADTSDDAPAVSPDGDEVLYNRNFDGSKTEVRFVSLLDRADHLIAEFADGDAATWSADGRAVFISHSQDNENSLWAYPIGGGAPWRILSSGEYLGRLSAGPNGLLAMEMQYPGGQLVAVTPHSDLPPRPMDASGLKTRCVDYASDGTFLATGHNVDTWGIWISGAGGALRELIRPPNGACAIRWSPDGSRFAYVTAGQHGFDVPVMTRGGEPVARLHYTGNDSGFLDWTSDGKSILTSREDTRGWRIWRTDLATADKSVPITPYGWWSPRVHGSMLFAERVGVAGIWRVDGTPRRLTDGPAPEAADVYNVAGDRLIYSDTSDPEHPMFSAVSVHGGPKDRLAPLPHGQVNFTFGVDPKSGAIVYTQYTDDTDIGLLRLAKQ